MQPPENIEMWKVHAMHMVTTRSRVSHGIKFILVIAWLLFTDENRQ